MQGALAIGGPDCILTATLGSCVGFCLHDRSRRIGGMTHIHQCVEDGPLGPAAVIAAAERLVNAMMARGARRGDLIAQLCGGARTLPFGRDHGGAISAACLDYLRTEGIPVAGRDLGGGLARRVQFWPGRGVLHVSRAEAGAGSMGAPVRGTGNAPDLF
ncbi:MAG: chemotaxis protein CheD [Pseudomonadota bacterium]